MNLISSKLFDRCRRSAYVDAFAEGSPQGEQAKGRKSKAGALGCCLMFRTSLRQRIVHRAKKNVLSIWSVVSIHDGSPLSTRQRHKKTAEVGDGSRSVPLEYRPPVRSVIKRFVPDSLASATSKPHHRPHPLHAASIGLKIHQSFMTTTRSTSCQHIQEVDLLAARLAGASCLHH